jgi:predicted XRE-type DNA-binding protein
LPAQQLAQSKPKVRGQLIPKCKESAKDNKKLEAEHSSGNVFKDIGFDDDEAESLLVRANLMSTLKDLIEASGLSQRQIAKVMGVQQRRVAEIVSMKTHLFSSDLLMRLLSRLGKKVSVIVKDKRKRRAS